MKRNYLTLLLAVSLPFGLAESVAGGSAGGPVHDRFLDSQEAGMGRLLEKVREKKMRAVFLVGHTTFTGDIVELNSKMVALRYKVGGDRIMTAYISKQNLDAIILSDPLDTPKP